MKPAVLEIDKGKAQEQVLEYIRNNKACAVLRLSPVPADQCMPDTLISPLSVPLSGNKPQSR